VVIDVVRAGVAGTEHQRERLSGRVAPGPEGTEPIAVLVGRAASCFSEWTSTSVASKSIVMSPCGASAQTTLPCLCHGLSDRAQL
jgi:hypothetical protein